MDQPVLLFPDEKLDTHFLTTAAKTLSFKLLTDLNSSLLKLARWKCREVFKGNPKRLKTVQLFSWKRAEHTGQSQSRGGHPSILSCLN